MASKVSVVKVGESDEAGVQVRRADAFQVEIDVGFFSSFKLSYVLLPDTEFANGARGATKKALPWHSVRTSIPTPTDAVYSIVCSIV